MPEKIQSVLFYVDKWTAAQARQFLNRHHLVPIKPAHVTDNYRRYRLLEPNYELYIYRKRPWKRNVDIIVERPKPSRSAARKRAQRPV